MTNPTISVIIPVYKVAQYLDKCIQTVVSQSYTALEIILVDDGSPDHCGQMCDAWAEKDTRIRVIHKENGGLSSARNAGLEVATGEYIMFVDSDDVLDQRICSKLLECCQQTGAFIAVCDPAHIHPGEIPEYTVSQDLQVMDKTVAIRQMWYQNSFLPSAWAKLYHRRILQNIRFTEGLLYEDIDVMHLLFWEAEKVAYTPSRLYGYNHREDSITTQKFSVRDLDILKIADKLLAFAKRQAPALQNAAEAYAVVAALRVELNAPKTPELEKGHLQARELLRKYGKRVLRDHNIRKKTRYGLMLYFSSKPVMRFVYKRLNRWK